MHGYARSSIQLLSVDLQMRQTSIQMHMIFDESSGSGIDTVANASAPLRLRHLHQYNVDIL